MPSAGQPPSSTLDRATRQQLDELDALMQRMLALPVDPPEESVQPPKCEAVSDHGLESTSIPPEQSPRADEGASAAASEPGSAVQAEPAEELHPAESATSMLSPGNALVPAPSPRERQESVAYSLPSPPVPISSPFAGLSPLGTVEVPVAESPQASEYNAYTPRLAWPFYPLLWMNKAFDRATAWLGPIGRWLRGPNGRALLGWGGLLLLAAALAWLAWDGMGWTW